MVKSTASGYQAPWGPRVGWVGLLPLPSSWSSLRQPKDDWEIWKGSSPLKCATAFTPVSLGPGCV